MTLESLVLPPLIIKRQMRREKQVDILQNKKYYEVWPHNGISVSST